MRKLIIIYCGEDGTAGKFEAANRRDDETNVFMASASDFQPPGEACDLAVIMPDVPNFRIDQIVEAYKGVAFVERLCNHFGVKTATKTVGAAPVELADAIAEDLPRSVEIVEPDEALDFPIKRKRGRPRKVRPIEDTAACP